MSEQPEREILTEEQFAERVGCSPFTIARRRKDKLINYRRDGRRVYYLAPDDIEAYHERMKRDAKGKPARA
jgi:hypothetical protein